MKKIVFLLFPFLICCTTNTTKHKSNAKEYSVDINSNNLFIHSSLADTLQLFISSVDNIPNPYGASKLNLITFEKDGNDTIISFVAYIGLYEIINSESICHFKGGYFVNGEYVAIYYCGFDNLNSIVNEELLSFEYVEEISTLFDESETYDWDYFYPEWLYKLSNNTLTLIKKREK